MDIKELAVVENQALHEAFNEFPDYVEHAEFALHLLSTFAKVELPNGLIFSLFLNQVQKHMNLSLLSALRRHHVQATLDLRYAIEAGCWAAFAIAHYDKESFAEFGKSNFIDPTPKLKGEMYDWIKKNYKPGNDSIKGFKDQLNRLSTHANLVDSWRNFHDDTYKHDFFDKFEDHHIKTDIWAVANACRGLIDIFYGINIDYKLLTISSDFLSMFRKLHLENDNFKNEIINDPRLANHKTGYK